MTVTELTVAKDLKGFQKSVSSQGVAWGQGSPLCDSLCQLLGVNEEAGLHGRKEKAKCKR